MSEVGMAIFIASIATLAIVTVIQFADRAYRYKKYAEGKMPGSPETST